MTSEKPVEFRGRWDWLKVAFVVAVAVVILGAILADNPKCQANATSAIELFSRFLGLVVAVLGVPALSALRHARSAEELFATASHSGVAILLGATLIGSLSWGAPVGAGLALVAVAVSQRLRDGSCAKGAEPAANSSD